MSRKLPTRPWLAAAIVATVLLGGCAQSPANTQPAARQDSGVQSAALTLESGEAHVPITGNLNASIHLVPDKMHLASVADITLSRPTSGDAVEGATIAASLSMADMPDMVYRQEVIADATGDYEVPMHFSMAGPWQLRLIILAGSDAGEVRLNVPVSDDR